MPQLDSAIIRKQGETTEQAIEHAGQTAVVARRTVRAAKVSAGEFVAAWMTMVKLGKDLDWMSERTGLKVASICARASDYRSRRGIRLPKLEREAFGAKALDVDALNSLIDSYIDDVPDSIK